MQFLNISKTTNLADLSEAIGSRNVQSVLHLNDVDRVPNVGQAFYDVCAQKIQDSGEVSPDRKRALLNTLTDDSDVFETAALMDEDGWKLLSSANTLPGALKIPDTITIPDSVNVLGNGVPVKAEIYKKVMSDISTPPHSVDPSIFNEYSARRASTVVDARRSSSTQGDPMQWFRIPWGTVTLYSSIDQDTIDFPVYPDEISDSIKANYTTMPDLLYQYEPWQIYNSSGPRTQTFSFDFHRDMWTGDHTDGKANELIRACEANCYPEFKGSAINVPRVTLYIKGSAYISGVMTDVSVDWGGPIGTDGWYLHCKLSITITEVSEEAIDYHSMKERPLIG